STRLMLLEHRQRGDQSCALRSCQELSEGTGGCGLRHQTLMLYQSAGAGGFTPVRYDVQREISIHIGSIVRDPGAAASAAHPLRAIGCPDAGSGDHWPGQSWNESLRKPLDEMPGILSSHRETVSWRRVFAGKLVAPSFEEAAPQASATGAG